MYYLYTTFSEVRSICSIIFSRNWSSDKLITFLILSSLHARLERLETQLDHWYSILERIEDRVSILDLKETVNLHLPGTVGLGVIKKLKYEGAKPLKILKTINMILNSILNFTGSQCKSTYKGVMWQYLLKLHINYHSNRSYWGVNVFCGRWILSFSSILNKTV